MSSDKEKINARLFDLVRYMRSELHAANLISDEEYSWLCHGCHLAQGAGSPSPRRLEDYDRLRAKVGELEQAYTIAKQSIENAHRAMDESGIVMERDKSHQGLTPRIKSIIARHKELEQDKAQLKEQLDDINERARDI